MASREAIDVLVELTDDPAHDIVELAARVWDRARVAHPQIATDDVTFFAYVGERLERVDELERRNIEDLYLACGCAHGDRAALATLETVTLPGITRAVAQLGADEVVQALRTQMLVGPSPGIAAYDGRAPLAIWLRVCATRIGLRQKEREQRNETLDDERLDALAPGVPNPELAYLQRHYGAQFHNAFADAVAALAPRERNLLRHAVIDGLGIDQIAAIYHIHRATAARQLKHLRTALVANTRERMRLALGIGETELDSIFRVLVAMSGLTLREILRPEPRKSER
jgi:RNA polymerase sigma-70 factor (ECF subfamily)